MSIVFNSTNVLIFEFQFITDNNWICYSNAQEIIFLWPKYLEKKITFTKFCVLLKIISTCISKTKLADV